MRGGAETSVYPSHEVFYLVYIVFRDNGCYIFQDLAVVSEILLYLTQGFQGLIEVSRYASLCIVGRTETIQGKAYVNITIRAVLAEPFYPFDDPGWF